MGASVLSATFHDARNFADVVKFGCSLLPSTSSPTFAFSPYRGLGQFPQWLRHSYIDTVFDNIDPKGLKEKLFLDEFYSINCIILGGRQVLLRSGEEGDLKAFIKGKPEWFNSQFCVIRKWEPSDVASERFTWIRCYRVPLHAWEEKFFYNLVPLFGTYLGQDVCTRSKHTLEYGRLFLAIPTNATVDKVLRVKIDNVEYDIRFVEDLISCWHQGNRFSTHIPSDSCSLDYVFSWIDRALDDRDSA
ncbi:hypothetical protein Lal_00032664 [Lupinus albus]|nr:hypothetical protein Lal_00032664 [Lupinus albus]